MSRRVADVLRTVGGLVFGHRTNYQRVFSAARWSVLEFGCALTGLLLDCFLPTGPVHLVGDYTVDGHPWWRVMESLSLRVHDVDFDRHEQLVRQGEREGPVDGGPENGGRTVESAPGSG